MNRIEIHNVAPSIMDEFDKTDAPGARVALVTLAMFQHEGIDPDGVGAVMILAELLAATLEAAGRNNVTARSLEGRIFFGGFVE